MCGRGGRGTGQRRVFKDGIFAEIRLIQQPEFIQTSMAPLVSSSFSLPLAHACSKFLCCLGDEGGAEVSNKNACVFFHQKRAASALPRAPTQSDLDTLQLHVI